jgi:hydroxymethylbilane synthase
MKPLLVATRASNLARAQSTQVATLLGEQLGRPVELVLVTTMGDQSSAPLAQIGGTGVFVAAVRQAVLAGEADVCVHSLKDLPTEPNERLSLAAVPARASALDVLVTRSRTSLAQLARGAVVGTGSPRRAAQMRLLRPDLTVRGVRGNVDSRIAAVDRGDLDAVILAEAGLARLGLSGRISEVMSVADMLPAPGQGALGIEIDAANQDADLVSAAISIDHRETRAAVTAERAALAALEAGCTAPVGALANVDPTGVELTLVAAVFDPDGRQAVRRTCSGPVGDARLLGESAAAELISAGAGDYLGERVS